MISTSKQHSNSSQNIEFKLKQINSKRKALIELEATLKKRINELKELCLKEGDITGHLPIEYPLQPREPIPQVRRRKNNYYHDCNLNNYYILPNDSMSSRQECEKYEQFNQNMVPKITGTSVRFPTRPTSTNSTHSSISTASSNIRNTQNHPQFDNEHHYSHIKYDDQHNYHLNSVISSPYNSTLLPNHFKQHPSPHMSQNLEGDNSGFVRASSIVSFSSSSCSATSSNSSNSTNSSSKQSHFLPANIHSRSYSQSSSESNMSHPSNDSQQLKLSHLFEAAANITSKSPVRSSKEIDSRSDDQMKMINNLSPTSTRENSGHRSSMEILDKADHFRNFNINGIEKFLPYYEETKPFQMSDFYKYSSKYRQKVNDSISYNDDTSKQSQGKSFPCYQDQNLRRG